MADDVPESEQAEQDEPEVLLGDISGVLQDVFADLFPPPPPEGEEEQQQEADETDAKETDKAEVEDTGAGDKTNDEETKTDATEADDSRESASVTGDPATGLLGLLPFAHSKPHAALAFWQKRMMSTKRQSQQSRTNWSVLCRQRLSKMKYTSKPATQRFCAIICAYLFLRKDKTPAHVTIALKKKHRSMMNSIKRYPDSKPWRNIWKRGAWQQRLQTFRKQNSWKNGTWRSRKTFLLDLLASNLTMTNSKVFFGLINSE